jgi:hypothetical protein
MSSFPFLVYLSKCACPKKSPLARDGPSGLHFWPCLATWDFWTMLSWVRLVLALIGASPAFIFYFYFLFFIFFLSTASQDGGNTSGERGTREKIRSRQGEHKKKTDLSYFASPNPRTWSAQSDPNERWRVAQGRPGEARIEFIFEVVSLVFFVTSLVWSWGVSPFVLLLSFPPFQPPSALTLAHPSLVSPRNILVQFLLPKRRAIPLTCGNSLPF